MHAGEYRTTNFTPVIQAMKLYEHVDLITSNPNKFQEYKETERKNADGTITKIIMFRQDALTNKIRKQAYEIYINAHMANEINVNLEPGRTEERLIRQKRAVSLCEEHLAAIQLCRKHFHLAYKKIKFWGDMTITVRDSLKAWHNSDKSRFRRN